MNAFDLYGVKEVADVSFYDTETGALVLYLDTLKVSTIDETAEQTAATGGKGNSELVIWDYGKAITVTLEDALFSMKSMAIMHGGKLTKTPSVERGTSFTASANGTVPATLPVDAEIFNVDEASVDASEIIAGETYLAKWKEIIDGGADVIEISAEAFPGTYRIVGDTYARSRKTGKDEMFQFVIERAKMGAAKTITMQAEGDPSVFNMEMRVLRPEDGIMMKLIKYPKKDPVPNVPVTGVTLDTSSISLTWDDANDEGTSQILVATVAPANATNKAVSWTEANPAVAVVDEDGTVTATGVGTTTVSVITTDGGFTAVCTVEVTAL